MGQRHQYILSFPARVNVLADNGRGPIQKVFHHQWLYGANAIFALDRALTLVATSVLGAGGDYLFGTDERGYTNGEGLQAIAAAVSVDPKNGYFHGVHLYDETYTAEKPLSPDALDNNDGVTVIAFEAGNRKPLVCFATPEGLEGNHWTEDSGCGPWTPLEYLSFYYSAAEREEWLSDPEGVKHAKRVITALKNIDKLSRPMSAEQLRALLPKFSL